jgi:hypothetical protein
MTPLASIFHATALGPTLLGTAMPLVQKPPIAIDACDAMFENPRNREYLIVGISFRNVSQMAATSASFGVLLSDSNDDVLQHESETIFGKFAPGIRIAPKKGALSGRYVLQSDAAASPAWEIRNRRGFEVAHVRCAVESATFADGTSWKPPASTEP